MQQHAVDHLALALGHVAHDRVRDGVVLRGLRRLGDGELRVVAPDFTRVEDGHRCFGLRGAERWSRAERRVDGVAAARFWGRRAGRGG